MRSTSLIDLFVPTLDGHEASVATAMAGLDAGVLVFSSVEALADFTSEGPTPMHGALGIPVAGGTAMVLLPSCDHEAHGALMELDTMEDVARAAQEAGGCAILAGGRLCPEGHATTEPSAAGGVPAQLVHMWWPSILARDLAFEDAALADRRPIGGSGPAASLNGVGRFATLLPIQGGDRAGLIHALNKGLGFAVERSRSADESPQDEQPTKRKRRRRRRKPSASDDVSSPEAPSED
jgi:hypothetical protein